MQLSRTPISSFCSRPRTIILLLFSGNRPTLLGLHITKYIRHSFSFGISLTILLWLGSNFLNVSQAQTKSSTINEHSKETPLNFQLEFSHIYLFRGGMLRDSVYLVKRNMKGFFIFLHPFHIPHDQHPPHQKKRVQSAYIMPNISALFSPWKKH